MNNSNIPTSKKVMTPLRLDPKLFEEAQEFVFKEKKNGKRGYSFNQFVTDLVERKLKENKNGK